MPGLLCLGWVCCIPAPGEVPTSGSSVVEGQALVPVCQSPGVQKAVSASLEGLCVNFLMYGGREGG